MRVFHNSERGIRLGTEMCLHVGDYVIDFDDSLLTMPGATFGEHLVNAAVRTNPDVRDDQGRPDVTLGGSLPGTSFFSGGALVQVLLCVSLDGEQSVECFDGKGLSEVLKWQSRVEEKSIAGELPRTTRSRYVHALITLAPGGRVEFRDLYKQPVRRTFWEVLSGAKPVVEEFLAVRVFSYDGKRVTHEDLPRQKIGQSKSPTSTFEERAAKAGCFILGVAFGFMFLVTNSALHGSVLWWILACAVFVSGGFQPCLQDPVIRTSGLAKWSLANFGAFIGAFVPYAYHCLTHLPQ